jgi:hypothetical protein
VLGSTLLGGSVGIPLALKFFFASKDILFSLEIALVDITLIINKKIK